MRIQLIQMGPLSDQSSRRRTSERRRLKMLRNLDEYKIPNPYRSTKCDMPDTIVRQLRRLDFLSRTSISMLHFDSMPDCYTLDALETASAALQAQQARWQALTSDSKKQDTVHTKDELSLYEEEHIIRHDHSRDLHFVREIFNEELCLFPHDEDRGEDAMDEMEIKGSHQILSEEDFKNYFVS